MNATYRVFWKGITPNIKLTGEHHCGLLKENRFQYEVTLIGNKLDEVGFLANNKIIGDYFDSIHETALSCELFAEEAAKTFLKADADCFKAIVRVWGIADTAYAEVELER